MNTEVATDAARAELKARAGDAIGALADVATGLGMQRLAAHFAEGRRDLESDTFKVIVCGRFKTGKSTFLNALLTNPAAVDAGGMSVPLPMDDLPTTATLTYIQYSQHPFVTMWTKDNRRESWSLSRFQNESVILPDEDEHRAAFANIKAFEIGYPSEFCRGGVTLLDSPGVDDDPFRSEITQDEAATCDAIIFIYSSSSIVSQTEREFAQAIGRSAKVFSVVNRYNRREVDERLRAISWNRIVPQFFGGPSYTKGSEFSAHDIYFVDALSALNGRLAGDDAAIARSGVLEFEARLKAFLQRERFAAHLTKYTTKIDASAKAMSQDIHGLIAAVKLDENLFKDRHERYEARLDDIAEQTSALTEVVAQHETEAEGALKQGAVDLLKKIRADLPAALAEAELPSTSTTVEWMKSAVNREKATGEAVAFCNTYLRERLKTWMTSRTDGAAAILSAVADKMTAQITEKFAAIESELAEMRLGLTGSPHRQVDMTDSVDLKNRVALSLALATATPAKQSSFASEVLEDKSATGFMGTALIGTALGVISAATIPYVLAGVVVYNTYQTLARARKRINEAAIAAVDSQLNACEDALIANCVEASRRSFRDMQFGVINAVRSLVAEERERVNLQMNANQRNRQEKAVMIGNLEQDLARIAQAQSELAAVVSAAREAVTMTRAPSRGDAA